MEHPVFAEAGANPGIEIWTIEKFEPVPIDNKVYGKFYNGDSYIVLKSTGDDATALNYDAHFWLGSKTTQDKSGSAAIWTITLDDMLGGRAVHHREVQGHESSLFLGYFKPAIRYLEGGNESGFNEVETNAGAEKRLLKLSGCENMRIEEVEADVSSLTKEHCFILEVEHDIFVLMPQGAKATQRRKIISVANTLRDDYHNGRATIEIIDEFSSDEDINLFFEALGSGSMDDIVSDDSTSTYSRDDMSSVYLYRVLSGEELDLVSLSKPYKQSQLSSAEVYILDTPCTGVYVWIGSEVDAAIKKNYNDIVDKYFDVKGYPAWVNVTRVTEGAESSTFKQYFHNWETIVASSKGFVSESDAGYFSEDAEQVATTAKLIGKSAGARGYMPDQGDGSLTVTRISKDQEDVTEKFLEGLSVFYQGDVYVVKYQYDSDGQEAYVVYCWVPHTSDDPKSTGIMVDRLKSLRVQNRHLFADIPKEENRAQGKDAEDADKQSALELVSQLEDELDNVAIVSVPHGKEPKHFLSIFKGNLAIVLGKYDDDYKPDNSKGTFEEDHTRLFRVEGTELGVDMRATQVPETADSLEDDDVYVLETPDLVYVWNGKESDVTEREAAACFVQILVGDAADISVLEQGDEPEEFWAALGGPAEEAEGRSGWRLAVNRRVITPTTLSAVTVSVTGKIRFEDLDTGYTQQDLSDDGAFILDTGEELYLWQGRNIPERFKPARYDIIANYIEDDGLERTVDSAITVVVKQGAEPSVFKKLFREWDAEMWDNLASYEDMKNDTKAANSK